MKTTEEILKEMDLSPQRMESDPFIQLIVTRISEGATYPVC